MPGKTRGRPTKLTPELSREICDYVRMGNYVETAAAIAGISKDSIYRWLKKGANAKSGIFREFSDAVKKAQAEAEARDVGLIGRAAKDQWQAAAWRLERKFPDRWGRKDRVEHTGRDGQPIQIEARNRVFELAATDPRAREALLALSESLDRMSVISTGGDGENANDDGEA